MGYADDEFPVNLDTDEETPDTITGLLRRAAAPSPLQSTSLGLFMTPDEIASVPGLPDYAYSGNGGLGDYADQRVRQDVGGQQGADGYVPTFDQVSLAPHNWNSSGLDLSNIEGSSGSGTMADKLELGSKAAEYFGNAADGWNAQNKVLGLQFGPEGPALLEKYSRRFKVLGPVGDTLGAAAEISKGAAPVPTFTGAGIRSASSLGGAELGAEGGGALAGALFGPPGAVAGGAIGGVLGGLAPNFVYRHMSDQQIGNNVLQAIDRAFLDRQ